MNRLLLLAALGVLTVVMAVFTPYVLRTEPTGKCIAWLFMLFCAIAGVAVFVRAELLARRLERTSNGDVSKP